MTGFLPLLLLTSLLTLGSHASRRVFTVADSEDVWTDRHPGIQMAMPGGISEEKPADAEIQAIADKVKPDVEQLSGTRYNEFVAVRYAVQVVAGFNYFIKIRVDPDKPDGYIHIRVFQSLDQKLSVSKYQDDKTIDDPLKYF